MSHSYFVTAFYKFFPIGKEQLIPLQALLQKEGEKLDMCGLLLVAPEGINATVAGTADHVAAFKKIIESHAGEMIFKDSTAETKPFKRFKVKIREEIVSIGDTTNVPTDTMTHVSVEEWDAMLAQEDVVVIDTRNDYETAIGMFDKAIDPKIKTFQEFPEYMRKAEIPKDKKVMIYCTGGIRCEKAAIELQRQGFKHVYQLSGGILKYLEQKPSGRFIGECFVFDHRVAVGKQLTPSTTYKLCPHCGDPGNVSLHCMECKKSAVICSECSTKAVRRTCSKNCAHHAAKHLAPSTFHA